jgi:hypothetical protein
MTVKLLAFNLAATVYLIVGSWHEEARLRAAYGRPYERYRDSGTPFYWPRLGQRLRPAQPISAGPLPAAEMSPEVRAAVAQ